MKLILLISFLLIFNLASADKIFDPFANEIVESYMFHENVKELLIKKSKGEVLLSLPEIYNIIQQANPDSSFPKDFFSNNVLNASSAIQFLKNPSIREETITFLRDNMPIEDNEESQWQKRNIEEKIRILEIGDDFSKIPNLSQDDKENFLFQILANVSLEEKIRLLESNFVDDQDRYEIKANLISDSFRDPQDAERIKDFFRNNPSSDMTELACNYIRTSIYSLTEEDDEGTLRGINSAKDEGYYEPYMMQTYKENVEFLQGVYSIFNEIGISSDDYCEDGKSLKELSTEDDYFDFKDIDPNYSEEININKPCLEFKGDRLFDSCNVADIIWMLENVEYKSNKMQKNVKYIDSRGIGNCNITLQTSVDKDKITTFMRIMNYNGQESEVTSTPRTLINLLMK